MKTEEEINTIRNRIQNEALLSIENNNGRGLIAIATGGGKSKIPIDYILKHNIENIALIVPTVELRDEGWKDEFEKWGAGDIFPKITRLCGKSAHKIKNNKFDLVIIDEVHNITDLSSEFFNNNFCKDIIALSATPPSDNTKSKILSDLRLNTTYHLTLDEAVELGIVAPYKIIAIGIPMNNIDKTVTGGTKRSPKMVTEYERYQELCNRVNHVRGNGYKFAVLARMHFIYGLETKDAFTRHLIDNYLQEEERTLIFCATQKQAEALCPHFHHSGKVNNHLELFKTLQINRLSCVKSLNEGVNIPLVDSSIIRQLTSQELDMTQRLGRNVRYRPGHEALIYALYAIGTKDEEWARKAFSHFDQKNIEYKTVEDFNYENKFKTERVTPGTWNLPE